MFSEIMSMALNNGLWAALFCLLFLYQLKDSRTREKKYTVTINSLTQSLGGLKDVKKDCESIKSDCKIIIADCGVIRAESGSVLKGIKQLGRKSLSAPLKETDKKRSKKAAETAAETAEATDMEKNPAGRCPADKTEGEKL